MSTLIAAYLLLQQSHALPVVVVQHRSGNDTTGSGTAWVSASDARGTYDLILGCLATSFLSAWIAWHPNLNPGHRPIRSHLRRLLWIIAVMAAPEIILTCAWEQRCASKKLQEEVNRLGQRAYDAEDVDSAVLSYEQHLHDKKFSDSGPSYIPRRLSAPVTTAPSLASALRPFGYTSSQSDASQPSPSIYSNSDSRSDTVVSSYLSHSRTPSRSSSAATTTTSPKPQFSPWTLSQAFFSVSGGITVSSSTFWVHSTLSFTPAGFIELARAGLLPSTMPSTYKRDPFPAFLVSIQCIWFTAQTLARLTHHLPLTLLEIHTLASLVITFLIYFTWFSKPYSPVGVTPYTSDRLTDLAALFAIDPHLSHTLNPHKNRLVYPIDITECTEAYTKASKNSRASTSAPLDEFEHAKIAELHLRASRALEHLRRRYRADVISSPVGQSPPPPSLIYRAPHVVPVRSEWRVDGSDALMPTPLARNVVPVVVAVLYGALVLGVSWASGVFSSSLEQGLWRGAGAVMLMIVIFGGGLRVTWKRLADRIGNGRGLRCVVCGLGWFMAAVYVVAKVFVLTEGLVALRNAPGQTWEGVSGVGFVPHVGW